MPDLAQTANHPDLSYQDGLNLRLWVRPDRVMRVQRSDLGSNLLAQKR